MLLLLLLQTLRLLLFPPLQQLAASSCGLDIIILEGEYDILARELFLLSALAEISISF